jgi:hypothetical protein
VSSRLCLYGGKEKMKKEGVWEVLTLFFLEGLLLEGKSMSLLIFCYCLDVYLKLYLILKLIYDFIIFLHESIGLF